MDRSQAHLKTHLLRSSGQMSFGNLNTASKLQHGIKSKCWTEVPKNQDETVDKYLNGLGVRGGICDADKTCEQVKIKNSLQ